MSPPQLLAELDGFDSGSGVIVMAATNRADILDPALLRPGRFSRRVELGLPDLNGRKDILKVHANGKALAGDVSLDVVAKRTPGFSGADLANLLNEAVILAAKRGLQAAGAREIDDSADKVPTPPTHTW